MFAKIFTQILDSSIAEDYEVRLVFEDLLKLSDANGTVDMTRESIARRTNVPLEIVAKGIAALEMPDPTSRTADKEGKRIVRLDAHRDWGWKIVNFVKYRESATQEMLRMGERERKAEWRRRKGFSPRPPLTEKTDKEAEAEAEQSPPCPKVSGTCPGQGAVRERHFPECNGYPTDKEVVDWGSRNGVSAWKMKDWWNEMEGCGWLDHNRKPIVKWQNVALRVKAKWEADGRPSGPPAAKTATASKPKYNVPNI